MITTVRSSGLLNIRLISFCFICTCPVSERGEGDIFKGDVRFFQLVYGPALEHDKNAMAEVLNLLEIRGDQNNTDALPGKLLDTGVNFLAGVGVDAARGFIEDQDFRLHRQTFSKNHLLLISS